MNLGRTFVLSCAPDEIVRKPHGSTGYTLDASNARLVKSLLIHPLIHTVTGLFIGHVVCCLNVQTVYASDFNLAATE